LLSFIRFSFSASLRRIRPGAKLNDELAIEGGGDPRQGVDARRPLASLHPRNRRLGRPAKLGEFALGDSPRDPPLGDAFGDQAEQLSIIRIRHSNPAMYSKIAM
jgi:hypothetical protein